MLRSVFAASEPPLRRGERVIGVVEALHPRPDRSSGERPRLMTEYVIERAPRRRIGHPRHNGRRRKRAR